jgi:hypothetical protein
VQAPKSELEPSERGTEAEVGPTPNPAGSVAGDIHAVRIDEYG